jgi:hypothetical protein
MASISRLLGRFKGALKGGSHNSSHFLKTFAQVSRNACNIPSESERYILIRSPSHFEADRCRDPIGMGNQAVNMSSQIVLRVWVGQYTHVA